MEEKKVIQIRDLSKMYKLYDKPSDRLKESLGLTKRERLWGLSEPMVPVSPRF